MMMENEEFCMGFNEEECVKNECGWCVSGDKEGKCISLKNDERRKSCVLLNTFKN